MAYDGAVKVGGPAQVRQLPGLSMTKVQVGEFENDVYILKADDGSTVLIDAAAEPDRLLELTGDRLDLIVTTHQHRDHWAALADVVAATGAPVAIGEPDAEGVDVKITDKLHDGEVIKVGPIELEVIRITGHTPGGVALLYKGDPDRPHLFTGDSLFPGGVGNTFKDDALFRQLIGDVETKLFDRLPDETWVYPGHGNDTTLGVERPNLPEWRARGW
ncbi:MAG TPA: MBL fold metallo-hydrolase [Mycobacteriales bacterium]|nr:MBL fold metallo-hydrolase [Mycobacteriales bacterium]